MGQLNAQLNPVAYSTLTALVTGFQSVAIAAEPATSAPTDGDSDWPHFDPKGKLPSQATIEELQVGGVRMSFLLTQDEEALVEMNTCLPDLMALYPYDKEAEVMLTG